MPLCFNDGKIGCGGVLRNSEGDVMLSTCHLWEGRYEIDVSEAVAARQGLSLAMEAGF